MAFLVIEGLDGAGKSTQINLLSDLFESKGIKYKYLHFPRLEAPIIGEMISKYLRGEFGGIEDVDPYIVALMYATDRSLAKDLINGWLDENYLVLVDRYLYSNIAFQCAKVDDIEGKIKLENWILELEYGCNKIPKPNLSLYMHVPFEFIENKLTKKREGIDRNYLKDSEDIHEKSLSLQKKVEAEYLRLVDKDDKFILVDCFDEIRQNLCAEDIHKKISAILENEGII